MGLAPTPGAQWSVFNAFLLDKYIGAGSERRGRGKGWGVCNLKERVQYYNAVLHLESQGEKLKPWSGKMKITGKTGGLHRFESQLYQLCAVLLQAGYLNSLCLVFLTIKLRGTCLIELPLLYNINRYYLQYLIIVYVYYM